MVNPVFAAQPDSQNTTPFNLNWRHGPKTRDLVTMITQKIQESDALGHVEVMLSTNRTRVNIVAPTAQRARMYRQNAFRVIRRLPPNTTHTGFEFKYSSQFLHILNELNSRVQDKTPFKKRLFLYEAGIKESGLRSTQVTNLVNDVALSLNVHPVCLGLLYEPKSKVYVPENVELHLKVVDNIFHYADGGVTRDVVLEGGKVHNVPGLIRSLRIDDAGQDIRAVVVSEHRNIFESIPVVVGSTNLPGLNGVILVATGGFSDFSVREFLHLLSVKADLQATPFLWLSDHDGHGLLKYHNLKYGSVSGAWAGPSMVCPQLQYAGMTEQIFDTVVAQCPERHVARDKLVDPNMTKQEEKKRLREYREYAEQKSAAAKRTLVRGSKAHTSHKQRLQAIENAGDIRTWDDATAAEVLDAMLAGSPCLPLSCVNRVDPHGLTYLISDVVRSVLEEELETETLPILNNVDSLTRDFAEMRSRAEPHSESSLPRLVRGNMDKYATEMEIDDDDR